MTAARKIEITVSEDVARRVEQLVEAGAYASESDLVRDALDALFSGESEPDPWSETEEGTRWLRGQVLPAYTDYMADPSRTIPMNEVFSGASERYMARKAARADKA